MGSSLNLQGTIWYLTSSYNVPNLFMAGIYGNGLDGDLTVTGSYTITRDSYFNNLTIQAGGAVKPNGCRIYVKNTLTINASGSLNDDGVDASGSTGGAGAGNSTKRNPLNTLSSAGGSGVSNGSGIAGGNVAASTVGVLNNSGLQAIGGTGGKTSPSTGTPGAGGTITANTQNLWGAWMTAMAPAYIAGATTNGGWSAGSGGGSGASSGVGCYGGGGGGGGGNVWLAAKNIVNNGRISANGGNGGDATGAGNAGSGGGGGGGNVLLITNTPTSWLGIVQASGGLAGTGIQGTGTTGSVGNNGPVCIINFGGN